MIFTLSRLISASKLSLQTVRYYRLPPNLTSFLDDYSREYKNNQNATVIESYKSIKSKVSEYEELISFIDTSTDKELVEIAELDWESRGIYRNSRSFQKEYKLVVLHWFVNCAQFCKSIYIRQVHCFKCYLR